MDDLKDVQVKAKALGKSDIWKSKDEFVKREAESFEYWNNSMTDESRNAALSIVKRAMMRLIDNLDVWVPAALDPKEGTYMDVSFRLLFSDIEEHVRTLEESVERSIREAAEGNTEMLQELEHG